MIKHFNVFFAGLCALFVVACTPTVQVQAPDKPIEINMNINIDHRIKVEVEKDLEKTMKHNADIF